MHVNGEDKKIWNTFTYIHYNTTFNYELRNKHIIEFTHLNISNFVKIDVMAELLYWIATDCTGVPNKVAKKVLFSLYISKNFNIFYKIKPSGIYISWSTVWFRPCCFAVKVNNLSHLKFISEFVSLYNQPLSDNIWNSEWRIDNKCL